MYSEDGEVIGEERRGDVEPSDFNDFMMEEFYDDALEEEMQLDESLDEIAESLLGDNGEGSGLNSDVKSNRVLRIKAEDLDKNLRKGLLSFWKNLPFDTGGPEAAEQGVPRCA